ncbi:MAG: right-handed parallel beta-helix repeat-containing protein [Actinomycetota bacterium]
MNIERSTRWRARMRRIAALCAVGAAASLVPLVPAGTASASPNRVVQEGESIQAAIDAAPPGTEIRIRGDHEENVWIHKDGITLKGLDGASITLPDDPVPNPCGFPAIICAIPPEAEESFPDFPPLYTYLRDVGVQDLELISPFGDGVATIFVRGADIRDNAMPAVGCSGVFVFASAGVGVIGNHVDGSVDCDNIAVVASERVRILNNTANDAAFGGISINDSSEVRLEGNEAHGNCTGIVAFDSAGPLPIRDVVIARNVANGNNTMCFPFGPEIPIGATGILGAGVDGLIIKNNTANDNVTDQFSVVAGGITVLDSPDGVLTEDLLLSRNTAFGNSSAEGPADIVVGTLGSIKRISKNRCDVSVPDPGWCTG